ncbi:MAG: S41 family peptidase [Verrucomicrobiota bacterium]|nr:S41 family peptidase [Verrucomicrobiota bacterium]
MVTPLEDTPAAAIGLLANDQIVAIESKSTEKMKLTEAIKLLKGKPGTKVTISIYRPSSENTFDVTITRAVIHIKSVKNVSVNEDKIGYIRITQFGAETSTLLAKALNDLDRKGAEALVLDLRNNPGGLLDSAVEVSSLFLPKGKLVVFTEGRDKIQKQEFFSGNGRKHSEYPMAILVNGGSASAAEIVSGCLQDYERAILIGEKTFGKGSVQTVVQLPDYSAIRLTTAKYYTPSKKIIHNHGIEPNIKIEISNEIAVKLAIQRSRPKEMKLPEGEEVIEDVQLKRAFEAIKECKIMNSDRINKYREIVKKYEIKDPKIEEK